MKPKILTYVSPYGLPNHLSKWYDYETDINLHWNDIIFQWNETIYATNGECSELGLYARELESDKWRYLSFPGIEKFVRKILHFKKCISETNKYRDAVICCDIWKEDNDPSCLINTKLRFKAFDPEENVIRTYIPCKSDFIYHVYSWRIEYDHHVIFDGDDFIFIPKEKYDSLIIVR